MLKSAERVMPLREMTAFDVAEEDPDVRGWDVVSAEGIRLGAVEDLLVDTEAMTVRYLDVRLDHESRNGKGSDHVLIPLSCADLDEEQGLVAVDGVDSDSIVTLPRYDGSITPDLEQEVATRFDPGPTVSSFAHLAARPGELI